MTDSNFKSLIIPLAVALKALEQVDSIAQFNKKDTDLIEQILATIFKFQADSAVDLYGNNSLIEKSADFAFDVFSFKNKNYLTIFMYIFQLIALEKTMSSDSKSLSRLSYRIKSIVVNADGSNLDYAADLSSIYADIISPLRDKVVIRGKSGSLNISSNRNFIRSLLLAAIRSLSYWRQLGGSRMHFFFNRSKILLSLSEITKGNYSKL